MAYKQDKVPGLVAASEINPPSASNYKSPALFHQITIETTGTVPAGSQIEAKIKARGASAAEPLVDDSGLFDCDGLTPTTKILGGETGIMCDSITLTPNATLQAALTAGDCTYERIYTMWGHYEHS